MSRAFRCQDQRRVRFPRVSGDEPLATRIEYTDFGFSPRERG